MKRTTAPNSASGLHVDRVAGTNPGTTGTAEDRNNLQEEICHSILDTGLALDGADQYQLEKAIILLSRQPGELVESEIPLAQVTLPASRSTTNPGYPRYSPLIDRGANKDVTTAQAPDLVAAYRAVQTSILGTSSFTATGSLSGTTVLTFASNSQNDMLLALLARDAEVRGWLNNGQAATFSADWATAATQRCINYAGTDYVISAVSTGARTITLAVNTGVTGSQTVIVYPHRVAGSTTSVRLFKLSGFVGVAAGDADGEVVEGWQRMDRGQGHLHLIPVDNYAASSGSYAGSTSSATLSTNIASGSIMTDATNGTPRTGKTTDPRTHGRKVYTFAGRLLATV